MRVLIAGAGTVGREVALALSALGDDVSVIDESEERFEVLGRGFDGTLHLGAAYDVDALHEAGIEEVDVFLALTASDNANLMAVQVAQEVFGVPRAIAGLDDPGREGAYRTLNVDFIAPARLLAQVLIERVHEPDFAYHLAFSTGEVRVVEMVLGAAADGLAVRDLEVEGELRVAAVQRRGQVMIPAADALLVPGDMVVAAVRRGVSAKVRHYLAATGEGA
jgi:trk system potassium uptake protein TrkA